MVDASPEGRERTCALLEADGRFIVTAMFDAGKQALAFLREHHADVVFLEMRLPDEQGETFLRDLLREDMELDVVAVTSDSNGETMRGALQLGAVDYLIKPLEYERFRVCLDACQTRLRFRTGARGADQKLADCLLHFDREACGWSELNERAQEVLLCLRKAKGHAFTVKELAQRLHISVVTARRYLKQLLDAGHIQSKVDYRTGGHPAVVYQWHGVENEGA